MLTLQVTQKWCGEGRQFILCPRMLQSVQGWTGNTCPADRYLWLMRSRSPYAGVSSRLRGGWDFTDAVIGIKEETNRVCDNRGKGEPHQVVPVEGGYIRWLFHCFRKISFNTCVSYICMLKVFYFVSYYLYPIYMYICLLFIFVYSINILYLYFQMYMIPWFPRRLDTVAALWANKPQLIL